MPKTPTSFNETMKNEKSKFSKFSKIWSPTRTLASPLSARNKFSGHHGANHPVKDIETGKVEITSMNHGFAVDSQTLPQGVKETHTSLFDGSNCGIRMTDRPVFSVQYHPEASPGPQDSYYLFERFAEAMAARAA